MFIFVWKTFYISNYHVLNTVYVERFWHTLFNICTCISSDLYFSCRLSTFVFLLVHYHSNSVIFENCDIFKLVYYIILISWSVEPGIDILSNLRLLKYWSEVKKKIIIWLQNIVLLRLFFFYWKVGSTNYGSKYQTTHIFYSYYMKVQNIMATIYWLTLLLLLFQRRFKLLPRCSILLCVKLYAVSHIFCTVGWILIALTRNYLLLNIKLCIKLVDY